MTQPPKPPCCYACNTPDGTLKAYDGSPGVWCDGCANAARKFYGIKVEGEADAWYYFHAADRDEAARDRHASGEDDGDTLVVKVMSVAVFAAAPRVEEEGEG